MASRRIVIALVVLAWATVAAGPGLALAQDASASRLFFAPTGRSVPAASGYVGTWEAILPMGQVGVTDWFSIGGGMPGMLTPKIRVYNGSGASASVGVLHGIGWIFSESDGSTQGGLAYGVFTKGGPDAAVTVGAITSYPHGSGLEGTLLLGFEKRVGAHTRFISENWIGTADTFRLLMAGVRNDQGRCSFDFGVAVVTGWGHGAVVFPVLNATWRFGRHP
jgi:hypothetical protein